MIEDPRCPQQRGDGEKMCFSKLEEDKVWPPDPVPVVKTEKKAEDK